jgi:hypothetical protein
LSFKNTSTDKKRRNGRTRNTYSQRRAVIRIGKPHKPTHRAKLAKECACPTQEEMRSIHERLYKIKNDVSNFKIFFPTLQKKLKHPTHKP